MGCVARKLDPAGFPDFTYPVTIKAMTIESLAVNIAAQTIPALKVDISAQSLEALNVNVSGCAVTLNVHEVGTANVAITSSVTLNVNIASQTIAVQVTNPAGESLSVAITGSVTLDVRITGSVITIPVHETGTASVKITESITLNMQIVGSTISVPVTNPVGESLNVAITSSVGLNVTITGSTINVPVTTAAGQHLDVDVISAITLNVNITGSAITIPVHEAGTANVAITDSITLNMQIVGSTINVPVVNPAGQSLNVAITSSVTLNIAITGSTINVPVTTADGQHVDVDIVSSVTINVTIQSCPVTLNVNIVSQAVDINIKTSSGANIVIDKLTQGAYTERRSILQNNGAIASMLAANKTYARGKFFPRGCRGFIVSVEIYCDNLDTVEHVFTIHFAPMPGMGDVFNVALSVAGGSSAAWRSADVKKMWNYDSMFIWVECDSDGYGRLGFDAGTPYDTYYSSDRAVWAVYPHRFWFRVNMAGETVGDLPVSGTINAIGLPNIPSFAQSSVVSLPHDTETSLITIKGTGFLSEAGVWFGTTVAPSSTVYYQILLYADGVLVGMYSNRRMTGTNTGTYGHSPWGCFFEDGSGRTLAVTAPIHFQRSLELRAKQTTGGAVNAQGWLVVNKII